jgi:hypothetical protein
MKNSWQREKTFCSRSIASSHLAKKTEWERD